MYVDTWPRRRESPRVRVFAVAWIVARVVEGRTGEGRNCHSAELQFLADACCATSRATSKGELMMRTRLNALCSCSHFPERCELSARGQPRDGSGGGAAWRGGDSAVPL